MVTPWPTVEFSINTDSYYIAIGFFCDILFSMKTRMQSLERQIDKVKRDLMQLDGLRMGSLSEQYNVCGTPGCRCKASPPEKHGPYHQLSYTRKGKSTTRFIRKPNLTTIKRQLRNYARLKSLVDQWIDLAIELSDLQLEEAKQAAVKRKQRA